MKNNENYRICTPSLRGRVGVGLLLLPLLWGGLGWGCKPSRAVEKQTDAVSVQHLSYADSLHTDFSFQFDKFDYWLVDSVEFDSANHPTLKGVKHGVIHRGEARNEITDVKLKQASDSTKMKAQDVEHPVIVPPKLPTWLLCVIFIFLFAITISRTRN